MHKVLCWGCVESEAACLRVGVGEMRGLLLSTTACHLDTIYPSIALPHDHDEGHGASTTEILAERIRCWHMTSAL